MPEDSLRIGPLQSQQGWIRQVVARRVPPQDIDDITQDVFLSAVRRSADAPPTTNPRGWLYQITLRRIADHFRTRYRHDQHLATDPRADLTQCIDDRQLQNVLRQATLDTFGDSLDSLPVEDLDLMDLKYNRRWTYRQIAEHYGQTPRQIEYQLLRIKTQLRRQISEDLC